MMTRHNRISFALFALLACAVSLCSQPIQAQTLSSTATFGQISTASVGLTLNYVPVEALVGIAYYEPPSLLVPFFDPSMLNAGGVVMAQPYTDYEIPWIGFDAGVVITVYQPIIAVPEPETLALLLGGLPLVIARRLRRRRAFS